MACLWHLWLCLTRILIDMLLFNAQLLHSSGLQPDLSHFETLRSSTSDGIQAKSEKYGGLIWELWRFHFPSDSHGEGKWLTPQHRESVLSNLKIPADVEFTPICLWRSMVDNGYRAEFWTAQKLWFGQKPDSVNGLGSWGGSQQEKKQNHAWCLRTASHQHGRQLYILRLVMYAGSDCDCGKRQAQASIQ